MTNMYRLVTSHLPQHQLPVNFMDHFFIPLCFVVTSFPFIILNFPLTLVFSKRREVEKDRDWTKSLLTASLFSDIRPIIYYCCVASVTRQYNNGCHMAAKQNSVQAYVWGLKVTTERWVVVLTHITPCCYLLSSSVWKYLQRIICVEIGMESNANYFFPLYEGLYSKIYRNPLFVESVMNIKDSSLVY